MYILRGVRYGTVRRYVLLGTGVCRYVLLGTGTVRGYGTCVPYRTCTVPVLYPHRSRTQCPYPLYVRIRTVRPRTDTQVVPLFRVPEHPIQHNSSEF